MIIIHLVGGLGNQMFQYAAARRLAHVNNIPLKLNISEFDHRLKIDLTDTLRSFGLNHFNIIEQFPTRQELGFGKYAWQNNTVSKLYRGFQSLLPIKLRTCYFQRTAGYDANILNLGENIFLLGYWQSWKYFSDIEGIIRSEFTLKQEAHPKTQEICQFMKSVVPVGIHVRRGDYALNPETKKYHGLCEPAYYEKAISLISERIRDPYFFVFSDDLQWVKQNLKFSNYPFQIIDPNMVNRDYEDLYLLSQCKHFIIANSTFSWWAAWLSNHPEKIVISPKRWFASQNMRNDDLIPPTWMSL